MGAGRVVDASVIHFSATFPVSSTPCGKCGPAAARWGFVTCLGCLEAGPPDPRIRARFVALTVAANDVSVGDTANDVPQIRQPSDSRALSAWLRQLDDERQRAGAEIARVMLKRRRR